MYHICSDCKRSRIVVAKVFCELVWCSILGVSWYCFFPFPIEWRIRVAGRCIEAFGQQTKIVDRTLYLILCFVNFSERFCVFFKKRIMSYTYLKKKECNCKDVSFDYMQIVPKSLYVVISDDLMKRKLNLTMQRKIL